LPLVWFLKVKEAGHLIVIGFSNLESDKEILRLGPFLISAKAYCRYGGFAIPNLLCKASL